MIRFKHHIRMTTSLKYARRRTKHHLLLVLTILLSCALQMSQAQEAILTHDSGDDVVRLRQALNKSTQIVVDTTLGGLRKHVAELTASTSLASIDAKNRLALTTDSIILSAQDSLDTSRQDSLRVLGRILAAQFASRESSIGGTLLARLSLVKEELTKARSVFAACAGCESRLEFDERLSDFREFADSLRFAFHDTASALLEDHMNLLADAYDTARDSVRDVRDELIDNRLSDIEVWRYGVSRLVLSSSYASHSSYRGRDNGILQQSIAPAVTYRHSSGLSLQASAGWLSASEKHWDNVQVTGGYDFRLNGIVGGSLSYSHYWFSDSSTSELSVFNDNAQAGLSFDWPVISISLLGSLNFGTASEFTLTTSVSHNVEIPLGLYNKITFSPSFSLVLGQQNSELTTLLVTKGKGKNAGTTTSTQTKATSTFSVLDYEVSLPATIEFGPVTLVPSATCIMPLNVVDASSTKSFVNLEFSVFLTIR
jgi:hypothetical protein